jgi:hypothetical protein
MYSRGEGGRRGGYRMKGGEGGGGDTLLFIFFPFLAG